MEDYKPNTKRLLLHPVTDENSSKKNNDNEFKDLVNLKRINKYTVSRAEIMNRLDISKTLVDRIIQNVRNIKGPATYTSKDSSVFFHEDELDEYLKKDSVFTMRTIKVDLRKYFDKEKILQINIYLAFCKKRLNAKLGGTPLTREEKEELVRLRNEIDHFCPALTHASNYNDSVLCGPVQVKYLGRFMNAEIITNKGRSTKENWQELLTTKNSQNTMLDRKMVNEAAIGVALNLKSPSSKNDADNNEPLTDEKPKNRRANKRIYIAHKYSRNKKYTVALALWLQYLKDNNLSIKDLFDGDFVLDDPDFSFDTSETESSINESGSSLAKDIIATQNSTVEEEIEFNTEQKKAIDLIVNERKPYVFLTGGPGTGKTYVLKECVKQLKEKGLVVLSCATTGISALNIDENGMTIHAAFSIGFEENIEYNTKGTTKINKYLILADVIVIDEVSMLRADQFVFIIRTLKNLEKMSTNELYLICCPGEKDSIDKGGQPKKKTTWEKIDKNRVKQLVFVGDFFQLPPTVTKIDKFKLELLGWPKDYIYKGGMYCFLTAEWQKLINQENTVFLQEAIRQRDKKFINAILDIRNNDPKMNGIRWINKYSAKTTPKDAVYICARNKTADAINESFYEDISKEEKLYAAEILTPHVSWLKRFESDYGIPYVLKLKIGTKVMFTSNFQGYKNGTLATVTKLGDDSIEVSMPNGNPVTIKKQIRTIKIYQAKKTDETVKFIPFKEIQIRAFSLRYGWAITIHKSQGLSLDAVVLYPDSWSSGMLYTAISRVKTIDGLFLADKIHKKYVNTSQIILDFYNNKPFDLDDTPTDLADKMLRIKTINTNIDNELTVYEKTTAKRTRTRYAHEIVESLITKRNLLNDIDPDKMLYIDTDATKDSQDVVADDSPDSIIYEVTTEDIPDDSDYAILDIQEDIP